MRWLMLPLLMILVVHVQPSALAQRSFVGSLDHAAISRPQEKNISSTQRRLNNLITQVTASSLVSSAMPINVTDACRAALALEANGYHSLSEDAWLSALNRFPNDALPYAGILNFYQRSGSSSKFFKMINKCAKQFPNDEVFLMARLQELNQRHEWDKSFELAKSFLSKPTVDDSAIIFEVIALLGNAQKERALELSHLLEIHDETNNLQKNGTSRSIYALCQLSLERPLAAEKICRDVLSRDSNSEIAALVLVQSLEKRDKSEEALAFMRQHFSHSHYSRALAGAYSSLLEKMGLIDELALVQLSIYFHDHLEMEKNSSLLNKSMIQNPHSSRRDMEMLKESLRASCQADRKSFLAILAQVEPFKFSQLLQNNQALFGGAKAMSMIELLLADCYRNIGRSDISRFHLLKAMETIPDYQSSKQIALFLDDEACELVVASEAYDLLSARFNEAKKDMLVQRRSAQLKRVHSNPALAQKYNFKRFVYQCYVKKLLSIKSERSESLRRFIESLAKDLAVNEQPSLL